MEQDKSQEHLVNCKADIKTEKAHKKVPNPKPMNKIFDGPPVLPVEPLPLPRLLLLREDGPEPPEEGKARSRAA